MTMRKFIITLHEDGSVQWNEYEEPKNREREAYNSAIRDIYYRLRHEHAIYLSKAIAAGDSTTSRVNLEMAVACKRISEIVENMAK